MEKKIAVITGASDGIGAEAARLLQEKGMEVIVIGRSPEKTKAVAESLRCRYYTADFSDLHQVADLANKLNRDLPRIDVLANNAGGIFGERQLTVDGHEKTMQVNHLAHFLLVQLLLPTLLDAKAVVINTSSEAHRIFARYDDNDLDVNHHYTARKAYGNAKLENILFTKALHARYHTDGLSTAAFHPGVVSTNFAHGANGVMKALYHTPLRKVLGMITPEKGADTLVWLASHQPGADWQSGQYYKKRSSAFSTKFANDPGLADRLWDKSLAMVADFLLPETKQSET